MRATPKPGESPRQSTSEVPGLAGIQAEPAGERRVAPSAASQHRGPGETLARQFTRVFARPSRSAPTGLQHQELDELAEHAMQIEKQSAQMLEEGRHTEANALRCKAMRAHFQLAREGPVEARLDHLMNFTDHVLSSGVGREFHSDVLEAAQMYMELAVGVRFKMPKKGSNVQFIGKPRPAAQVNHLHACRAQLMLDIAGHGNIDLADLYRAEDLRGIPHQVNSADLLAWETGILLFHGNPWPYPPYKNHAADAVLGEVHTALVDAGRAAALARRAAGRAALDAALAAEAAAQRALIGSAISDAELLVRGYLDGEGRPFGETIPATSIYSASGPGTYKCEHRDPISGTVSSQSCTHEGTDYHQVVFEFVNSDGSKQLYIHQFNVVPIDNPLERSEVSPRTP